MRRQTASYVEVAATYIRNTVPTMFVNQLEDRLHEGVSPDAVAAMS